MIERQLEEQPHSDGEFAWIFEYIKANKDMFEIYFKLGISRAEDDYNDLLPNRCILRCKNVV